jgi:poly-gamma-glutamate synthesis protein (capsule biosynthesis protein)
MDLILAALLQCAATGWAGDGAGAMEKGAITLFLCGDVMPGRGIDQILPCPGDPRLHESYVKNAMRYVELAERASGPMDYPVDPDYIWGDALDELEHTAPDLRIINLETSVTTSDEYWPGKGIHYRMHPRNISCINAAGIDCSVLANNHVLDWGHAGLDETMETLARAGIASAGAGADANTAAAPAVLEVAGKGRVLVFSCGLPSSGIPANWGAARRRPGVNLLEDLSDESVRNIAAAVAAVKQPGDVAVVSIHWGGNWGYRIPDEHRAFARSLIDDAQVDLVHGHSSHHVKGMEVYKERLILYGCGDFLNDYEGIGGHEAYRSDLALMYFAGVNPSTGQLAGLRMVPMQIRKFRANRVTKADALWMREVLNREGAVLGTRVEMNRDNSLNLCWD